MFRGSVAMIHTEVQLLSLGDCAFNSMCHWLTQMQLLLSMVGREWWRPLFLLVFTFFPIVGDVGFAVLW